MKRASEVPPPVESFVSTPVDFANRARDEIGEGAAGGEEGDGVGRVEGEFVRRLRAGRARAVPAISAPKTFGRPKIVEADVEDEPRFAGNDIGRGIADVDGDHLEVGGQEVACAGVERRRMQRVERGGEPAQRIVGEMGIGDMALLAQ